MLALPFPFKINELYWYYRILYNLITIVSVSIIVTITNNDRYMLLFVYEFGILIFIITVLTSIFIPAFYVIASELCEFLPRFKFNFSWENADRTFDSLRCNNAYKDMEECLAYGIVKGPDNIENAVKHLLFVFLFFELLHYFKSKHSSTHKY